jgi:hypothetical protein
MVMYVVTIHVLSKSGGLTVWNQRFRSPRWISCQAYELHLPKAILFQGTWHLPVPIVVWFPDFVYKCMLSEEPWPFCDMKLDNTVNAVYKNPDFFQVILNHC